MTWQEAVMGASGMAFVLVITVVIIVQVASTWRARMSVAREEAHRQLAEDAARVQQETARQLEQIRTELAAINERTAGLERLLAQVGEPWER
jgi:hypothetical protein